MKIGITNKPKQRHSQLSRTTPFSFDCVEVFKSDGCRVIELEKFLLSSFNSVNFTQKFDGHTEWRVWSDKIRGHLKNEFKK